MRTFLTITAAAAFMAWGAPASAQGAGPPDVNGSFSVTPPGARGPYATDGWRRHHDWRSAQRGDSLPRYAQSVPDNYWPGPQNWQYTPGPL